MKSPVVKRSIVIAGHKTSVSLEDAFWKGLKEIAGGRDLTLSDLVATIDTDRQHGNLSSAIRLFVLDHYRSQAANENVAQRLTRERCQPRYCERIASRLTRRVRQAPATRRHQQHGLAGVRRHRSGA